MARRRKTSAAEDLVDLVARQPWWVGAALALVSHLLLHGVASQPIVAATQRERLGAMVTQLFWPAFASLGPHVLPLICLAGAGMSVWRRRRRGNLVFDLLQSRAADALDGMRWRKFEKLVGEGSRQQADQVIETGGGGADGAVDLVRARPCQTGGEKFLVQCKPWRAFMGGANAGPEFWGCRGYPARQGTRPIGRRQGPR